ncbi:merozoite surface protein 9 [Plasmodium sp. DRC-Itaito]|nr:merozoite surface protein 9 [Plasmodium sp. DRC-Itaito]
MMNMKVVLFSFLLFVIRSNIIISCNKNEKNHGVDMKVLNNYENLFKVVKCEYCHENTYVKGKKPYSDPQCAAIKEECIELLKQKEYTDSVTYLMDGFKSAKNLKNNEKKSNTEEMKDLVNFLQSHKKLIEALKKNIETIQNKKSLIQNNKAYNPLLVSFIKKMNMLKDNVEYIEKNQDLFKELIHQNNSSNLVDTKKKNFSLKSQGNKKETSENDEEVNDEEEVSDEEVNDDEEVSDEEVNDEDVNDEDVNDEDNNDKAYELGSVPVDDLLNDNMKNIIRGDNFMDVVKSTLAQTGGLGSNDLTNFLNKGKELGETFSNITNIKLGDVSNLEEFSLDQLDILKNNLVSYEFILEQVKTIVLNKLKDLLLRLLYKAYVSYKKRKAQEKGLPEPTETATNAEYVEELKKGILEMGIKLLFSKVKSLLGKLKNKMFPKKKEENQEANKKGAGSAKVKAQPALRGVEPTEDSNIMNSINNVMDEIDFFEKELIENNNTPNVVPPTQSKNTNVTGMDENFDNHPENYIKEEYYYDENDDMEVKVKKIGVTLKKFEPLNNGNASQTIKFVHVGNKDQKHIEAINNDIQDIKKELQAIYSELMNTTNEKKQDQELFQENQVETLNQETEEEMQKEVEAINKQIEAEVDALAPKNKEEQEEEEEETVTEDSTPTEESTN